MAIVGVAFVVVVLLLGGGIYAAGHHADSKLAATTLSIDRK